MRISRDRGDRGVDGERGPKGDHGQHGDNGADGARGPVGARGPEGPVDKSMRLAITAGSVALVAIVISVVVAGTVLHTRSDTLNIQDGRRLGVISTCGINKAFIQAGRTALQRGVLLPGDKLIGGKFVPGALTKQLGPDYPAYAQRVARARDGADAYEQKVVSAILQTVKDAGGKAPVARGKDGKLHISCTASLKVSGLK
jgi:hypothetical protein